ncbi:flagellar biosynthetic protein FliR [Thermoclostridium stercorarium subsp. stercorarium DSM 8532]|uniref:Flagellar biosynthetic protein FliR n=2 Tax=Thermoclostridium stercorarium TaxID=1510 RepID=M4Y537_THES1|nr:flagellar biosynthetic protein FliR [Thermoclostridium stercorarium]AGC67602.1 flagellar biosynthetic protein FliR [Thermoclostridium stercorarium subsp. stercorarium DSM 8532]AGI38652.1 FliR [Thermoclostridium stercorarium subsp. stercorarium DSM 8532]ANW98024.1 flagellar biosynthetic protein FliR [Thermoclostridium stercorarium subsp. thermolacticum DSM 2910]
MDFDALLDLWDVFLLIFVRVTGLFVVSPIFGRRDIPAYYKIGFSFLLAIVISSAIPMPDLGQYSSLLSFFLLVIKEFLIGLILGYISYLITTSIYFAGQIIDMHMGFGMVNVFDPLTNIQIPVTANFYYILATLMMLAIDGHHLLIYTLCESFTLFPIGSKIVIGQSLVDFAADIITSVFSVGFKIAAPITAALLITDMALGIIAKAVPQVNVFIVGLPLKILVGFFVITVTIAAFRSVVHVLMGGMQDEIVKFLGIIRGE